VRKLYYVSTHTSFAPTLISHFPGSKLNYAPANCSPLRQTQLQQHKLFLHAAENPDPTQPQLSVWATAKLKLRSHLIVATVIRMLQKSELLAGLSADELRYKSPPNPAIRDFNAKLSTWIEEQEGKDRSYYCGTVCEYGWIRQVYASVCWKGHETPSIRKTLPNTAFCNGPPSGFSKAWVSVKRSTIQHSRKKADITTMGSIFSEQLLIT